MFTILIDNEEFITGCEQLVAEVIGNLAEEFSPHPSGWTPMVHECIDEEDGNFSVFAHSDNFDDADCNNEEGIAAWEELLGCSLMHDIPFWEAIQKLLQIKVVPAA